MAKPNNAHDAPICQTDIECFFYKNLKINLKAKLSMVNMVSFQINEICLFSCFSSWREIMHTFDYCIVSE